MYSIKYINKAATTSSDIEILGEDVICNNGQNTLKNFSVFSNRNHFSGWLLRIKVVDDWYYLYNRDLCSVGLANKDSFASMIEESDSLDQFVFQTDSFIPYIPINQIDIMQAFPIWNQNVTECAKQFALF